MDELARQIAALSASASRPRSPSQTRRNARRSSSSAGRSPAPDLLVTPPRSLKRRAVLKSAQRDALRPVRSSRETWTAVARGGEQLLQRSQPPLCDGSAHRDKLFGRYRRRSLRLPPFRLRERRTQTSYELFTSNDTIVRTYDCIPLRLDLGLRR
jgi:hypothetical protein